MRIGLASDSFGNVPALQRAFATFSAAGAQRIFFLGGLYADVDAVLAGCGAGAAQGTDRAAEGDLGFLRAVEGVLARRAAGRGEDEEERLERRVVRVASKECPEALRGEAPRKVYEMVDGLICCLVHDKGELSRDDIANATVIFHGNAGHPALLSIGPRFFVTPGHLRALDPDGRPPTVALLDVGPHELELIALSAFGEELGRERMGLPTRGKVSVR